MKYKKNEKHKAEVIALKSFGITNAEIATYLGVSPDTIERHYKQELKTARIRANAEVASKLFKKATKDEDLSAIIFWLKTQGRWRTEDSKANTEATNEISKEIISLRERLSQKHKKDY